MQVEDASQKRRVRRTPEQQIADLEKRITSIKARAERQRHKPSPAQRHVAAALRSIDKAAKATDDNVVRKALLDARATLSACSAMNGTIVPAAPSPAGGGRLKPVTMNERFEILVGIVTKSPGQYAGAIAASIGSSPAEIRRDLRELIFQGKLKTTGERRGTRYFPARVAQ